MAILPAISSTISAFGCDLLRLFWILATVAVLARGMATPRVRLRAPLDKQVYRAWPTGGCVVGFFSNGSRFRYLIASYEAVAHRTLGR